MRTFGLCASIFAMCNIVAVSSPAFAQDDAAKPADTSSEKASTDSPAPAKTSAPASTDSDDAMAEVHIDSPAPVSLERRAPGTTTWENVCTSPCDVKTSTTAEYRIVGTDLNESKTFMIDGTKGKVVLGVAPGTKARENAGLWILVGGGVFVVTGLVILLVGSDKNGVFPGNFQADDGQTHGGHLNAMMAGGAFILTGIAGGIFGTAWLINNKHTAVGGDVAKTIDEKPAPAAEPGGGGVNAEVKFSTKLRQPTWNAPKPTGMPAAFTMPVWQGTF